MKLSLQQSLAQQALEQVGAVSQATYGDIWSKIVLVLTNFVVYWTFHPQFQKDVFSAGSAIWNGLQQDVLQPQFALPEAWNWTLREQVENRGYAFEEHDIVTEDGYILKAFRVPGKLNESLSGAVKQPVIMQHGLIDDGGTWFFNNATMDLSLELVDLGYDIWATNSRGSAYSNRHVNYTTDDHAFWNFTMNEMGKYDVPANVHYVLANALGNFEQVIWFGHSQGTAQWFIANALDEKLAAKFKAFIGLAPVMYVYNQNSVLVTLLNQLEIPDLVVEYLDSLLYVPDVAALGVPFLHAFPRFVWAIVQTVVGFDKEQHLDLGMLPMMARNDVGGTSTKNLLHWVQMVRSGYFQQFDYGSYAANQAAYGQYYPPQYDTANFKTNLAHVNILLFAGGNDALVQPADYAKLLAVLPPTVKSKVIADYNHLDYMWSADVNEYVNDDVRAFLASLQ